MPPETMRALRIPAFTTSPSSLLPTTISTPNPSPTQLLIRITHCSPQHADLLHARGTHQNNHATKGWCHPPFVLGYNFAGTIETAPSSSSPTGNGLKRGDRVFGAGIGAFAEYVSVEPAAVRRVPAGLGLEQACAAAGGAVSYAAVARVAKVRAGETVVVSGASGGLGGMCCAVAKARGARVVALVGDEAKGELVRRELGVDLVVVGDDLVGEVMEFTGGKGAEVVFDNTGLVNDGLRCLAYEGMIVVLGFAARKGIMESVKMNRVLLKSASIVGYRFGESGRRDAGGLEEIWKGYLDMLESGQIKTVLFGKYEGLEDIGRALKDLEERKVCGKIVVKVADVETAKL